MGRVNTQENHIVQNTQEPTINSLSKSQHPIWPVETRLHSNSFVSIDAYLLLPQFGHNL